MGISNFRNLTHNRIVNVIVRRRTLQAQNLVAHVLTAKGVMVMSTDKESVGGFSKDYMDERSAKIRAHVQKVLRKLTAHRSGANEKS